MLKKTIYRAECVVEFDWYLRGSVLRGTVDAGATECRTHLVLDSPELDQEIIRIVRLAKQGCFAEKMVQQAVPLVSTYVLNGVEREVPLEQQSVQPPDGLC